MCCDYEFVLISMLLVEDGQLRLALTCLMRPAADTHMHGFLICAFDIFHRTGHQFEIPVLLLCSILVRRLPVHRTEPTLFFRETLVQLLFLAILFSSLFVFNSRAVF